VPLRSVRASSLSPAVKKGDVYQARVHLFELALGPRELLVGALQLERVLHDFGLGQALGVRRQSPSDRSAQHVYVEIALDDVVVGPGTGELRSRVLVAATGEYDGGTLVSDAPHLLEKIDGGHSAQLIVEEDQLGFVIHEVDQRPVGIRVVVHFEVDVGDRFEDTTQQLELALVVIDGEDRHCFRIHGVNLAVRLSAVGGCRPGVSPARTSSVGARGWPR
jgi:hypothetical protein